MHKEYKAEKYIRDFFSIRETSYNLRENGVNLCVPKFNLNFMTTSFTYKCAQLWNKLPEDVKLADNVNFFKSKLRSTQLYNFYIYIYFFVIFIIFYIHLYTDYGLYMYIYNDQK